MILGERPPPGISIGSSSPSRYTFDSGIFLVILDKNHLHKGGQQTLKMTYNAKDRIPKKNKIESTGNDSTEFAIHEVCSHFE